MGEFVIKTCIICNEVKPLTDFSTLPRRDGNTKHPEDSCCTSCYWNQLVLVYPSHSLDGVTYLPHPVPQTQYIDEMQRLLPRWLKDKDVKKAYSVLGDVKEQVRPFREFVEGLGLTLGVWFG